MTPREKVLADRLGIAMAQLADYEIDFDLERESRDERNVWREVQRVILGSDEASRAERSRRRKLVSYEISMTRIGKWLRKNLRVAKEKAA